MADYWKDNGIAKPPEVIVCAANIYGDLILTGARHWDKVMRKQAGSIPDFIDLRKEFGEVQGFINQFGEFRTRKEAMKIVIDNGQAFNKERNGGDIDELYSEGLY